MLLEIHRIILEQDREIFENDKIIYRIQSDQQALINKLKMAVFSLDQVKEITTVEFDIIEQIYNSEQ